MSLTEPHLSIGFTFWRKHRNESFSHDLIHDGLYLDMYRDAEKRYVPGTIANFNPETLTCDIIYDEHVKKPNDHRVNLAEQKFRFPPAHMLAARAADQPPNPPSTSGRLEPKSVPKSYSKRKDEAPVLLEGAEALVLLHEAPKELDIYTPVPTQLAGLDARVWDWLCKLHLAEYGAIFHQHRIDYDALSLLSVEDLREMGIALVGVRRKLHGFLPVIDHEACL